MMVKRIEPVCANCQHLRYTYTTTGMGVYHRCACPRAGDGEEEPVMIGASQTWTHVCEKWEVKQ